MKKLGLVLLLTIGILMMPLSVLGAASLDDGTYTVDVTLSGGSGRSTVESPCDLTISDGKMTAEIIWSSSSYDLMIVDDTAYYPINEEGNSTFEIPVTNFDAEIKVSAETVAMSEPHMIDYILMFDSATLKEAEDSTWILLIGAGVIAVAVIAVLSVKIKRKNRSKNA